MRAGGLRRNSADNGEFAGGERAAIQQGNQDRGARGFGDQFADGRNGMRCDHVSNILTPVWQ
jgi:hypothetical protein